MYTTGWGFQTNLGLLVKAAHTWQAVRLLRLVRNKHEQHLALGTARVNLASLPPEIMRLIETEVISAAECELYTNEPFYFDRDCCFESVCDMKLKDNWYYLQFVDFAVENGYDLDDEDERLTAGLAFDTSPAGQAIEQDLYDEHWSSGECEELQATSDFWASIAEGLNYCSPKDQIHDLVSMLNPRHSSAAEEHFPVFRWTPSQMR